MDISIDSKELTWQKAFLIKMKIHSLLKISETNIILDMENVKVITSTGIGILSEVAHESNNKKYTLKITNLRENLFDILSIIGLDKLITIEKAKK